MSKKKHDGGFAKAWRGRWDHPLFKTKQEASVWAWMTDTARVIPHEFHTRFGKVRLEYGQLLISERMIASEFGLHKNTVRGLLTRMLRENMIALKKDHDASRAGTIVTIVKFAEYQGVNADPRKSKDQDGTNSGTKTGPRRDQDGTTREEGKEGEEGKDSLARTAARIPDGLDPDLKTIMEIVQPVRPFPDVQVFIDWKRDRIDMKNIVLEEIRIVTKRERAKGNSISRLGYFDERIREIWRQELRFGERLKAIANENEQMGVVR